MMLLKRCMTALVLFVFLFFVIYFQMCMVGGGIAGAREGMRNPNPQDSFEQGRQAGGDFVRENLAAIAIGSLGISLIASLAFSFSGILPWCRKPKQPTPPPIIS